MHIHKPIQIKELELSFPHKTCFEDFTTTINYGSRISIIGRNGGGKSTLLKILLGSIEATSGDIKVPQDAIIGYVPQIIDEFRDSSGGERFNEAMTKALSLHPNILLLDEPTNHLDQRNHKSLMRMLQNYQGTLIVISHDTELLRNCVHSFWHIDNGRVQIFSGNYDDYINELKLKRASIEQELTKLEYQKKDTHKRLMQEQQRAAKSKSKGTKNIENNKWTKMAADFSTSKAEKSQGKNLKDIANTKNQLSMQLSELRLPEIITPKFHLNSGDFKNRVLVQITGGSVGYSPHQPVISNINLSVSSGDRVAILGDNGSGKTTLVKAILSDESVYKEGDWSVPSKSDIGYLDQHYSTLGSNKLVFEIIKDVAPNWTHAEIRNHLNDFLFRKNEEVNNKVAALSGGEKARLSLAQIAACTPKLLILDEITNNIDLETKQHIVQVLKSYPGAILVISHNTDFLKEIEIKEFLLLTRIT